MKKKMKKYIPPQTKYRDMSSNTLMDVGDVHMMVGSVQGGLAKPGSYDEDTCEEPEPVRYSVWD